MSDNPGTALASRSDKIINYATYGAIGVGIVFLLVASGRKRTTASGSQVVQNSDGSTLVRNAGRETLYYPTSYVNEYYTVDSNNTTIDNSTRPAPTPIVVQAPVVNPLPSPQPPMPAPKPPAPIVVAQPIDRETDYVVRTVYNKYFQKDPSQTAYNLWWNDYKNKGPGSTIKEWKDLNHFKASLEYWATKNPNGGSRP